MRGRNSVLCIHQQGDVLALQQNATDSFAVAGLDVNFFSFVENQIHVLVET